MQQEYSQEQKLEIEIQRLKLKCFDYVESIEALQMQKTQIEDVLNKIAKQAGVKLDSNKAVEELIAAIPKVDLLQ